MQGHAGKKREIGHKSMSEQRSKIKKMKKCKRGKKEKNEKSKQK